MRPRTTTLTDSVERAEIGADRASQSRRTSLPGAPGGRRRGSLPVERYFHDAKVGTIWEGTSDIQQRIICRELGLYA